MINDISLNNVILTSNGPVVIDVDDYIKDLIPEDHIKINIKNIGDNNREITVEGVDLWSQ